MNSAPLGGHNYTFFREKVCKKQLYTTCLPSNSRQTLRDKLVAIVNHLAEGPIFPLGSGRDKNKAKKDWILGWHSSEGHKDSVLLDRWSVAIQFRFYCFRTCWNWLVLIWNFTWFETWLWLEDGGVTNWHASSLRFIQCDILRIVFKVEKKKVKRAFQYLNNTNGNGNYWADGAESPQQVVLQGNWHQLECRMSCKFFQLAYFSTKPALPLWICVHIAYNDETSRRTPLSDNNPVLPLPHWRGSLQS